MVFFFFQAEDGIRDVAVTGVQTCALPIYGSCDDFFHAPEFFLRLRHLGHVVDRMDMGQIGRASCREKSVDLGGRRIIKKKKKKKKEKTRHTKVNEYMYK